MMTICMGNYHDYNVNTMTKASCRKDKYILKYK